MVTSAQCLLDYQLELADQRPWQQQAYKPVVRNLCCCIYQFMENCRGHGVKLLLLLDIYPLCNILPVQLRFSPRISGNRLSNHSIHPYAVHLSKSPSNSSEKSMSTSSVFAKKGAHDLHLHHEVKSHSRSCCSTPTGWQINGGDSGFLKSLTADDPAVEQETSIARREKFG